MATMGVKGLNHLSLSLYTQNINYFKQPLTSPITIRGRRITM